MSLFGIRLPNLSSTLPMLSTAASFIPGVGPLVKGGLLAANALTGGASAQRNQRNIMSQQSKGYQDMLSQGQQQNQQYNQALLPMLQQYQQMISDNGIPNFDARYRSTVEGQAPEFDNAVHSAFMDFGDRGLGVDNTGLQGAVGNIRTRQAQAGLNTRRDLMIQGMNNKMQMLSNGVPMLQGMMNNNNSLQMNALQGLGGVGGMYGSQANDAMGGLGQLGSLLPSILRLQGGSNPNAGNNMLGTNQKTGYNPNDPTGGGIDANLYPDQNRVMGPQSQGRKGMRIFGMNMG